MCILVHRRMLLCHNTEYDLFISSFYVHLEKAAVIVAIRRFYLS